jgi:hypothetical protein
MTPSDEITIRRADAGDTETLRRLAGRDSRSLPADDFLIAEVGGEARAALGIRGRSVIADPFRPTAELVELLQVRAAGVRRAVRRRRPRRFAVLRSLAPAGLLR